MPSDRHEEPDPRSSRGPAPSGERRPGRGRRRITARWGLVLALLATTWALMFYLIYRAVQSGKL